MKEAVLGELSRSRAHSFDDDHAVAGHQPVAATKLVPVDAATRKRLVQCMGQLVGSTCRCQQHLGSFKDYPPRQSNLSGDVSRMLQETTRKMAAARAAAAAD